MSGEWQNDDEAGRWAAVAARDPAADGHFVYVLAGRDGYCRPSCRARRPVRERLRYFPDGAAAEAAGYRPCKRCCPDRDNRAAREARLVAEACRRIEAAEELPSLDELAAAAGLSRFHFHRLFKAQTGLTPKAYAAGWRAERVRRQLIEAGTVSEAIYAAGYNSNARFYSDAPAMLGMTPGDYRSGAPGARIRFALGATSLGALLVAATDKGLCAILLGDDPEALLRDLQDRFPRAELVGGDAGFESWVAAVVGLVEAPALGLSLPLDIRGTAFQQRVWQALREIPPGQTRSYAEVAARIGSPRAVRAVAQACAANPLAVAIPCHRVVRQDGALSGYRWGIARKRRLLEREAGA